MNDHPKISTDEFYEKIRIITDLIDSAFPGVNIYSNINAVGNVTSIFDHKHRNYRVDIALEAFLNCTTREFEKGLQEFNLIEELNKHHRCTVTRCGVRVVPREDS